MTRTRTLFAILAPALIAGGIVAVSATSTRADDDDDEAREAEQEAREEAREAQREAREAQAEAREQQKAAMQDAKKQMKQARKQAREQLADAVRQVEGAPIPEKLKKKILAKLEEAAGKLEKGFDKAADGDWDSFGAEMEAMGEAMEAMGDEFENFGDGWDDWAQQFDGHGGAIVVNPDNFDWNDHGGAMVIPVPPTPPTPPTPPDPPSFDVDMSDLDIVIDVQDLSLGADQIEELHIIFESEQDVLEPAREKLEDLSVELREALEDPSTSEASIEKMVDAISDEEAKIRKAQILAWVKSRKVLDGDQRTKVQGAKVKVKKAKGPRRVR